MVENRTLVGGWMNGWMEVGLWVGGWMDMDGKGGWMDGTHSWNAS